MVKKNRENSIDTAAALAVEQFNYQQLAESLRTTPMTERMTVIHQVFNEMPDLPEAALDFFWISLCLIAYGDADLWLWLNSQLYIRHYAHFVEWYEGYGLAVWAHIGELTLPENGDLPDEPTWENLNDQAYILEQNLLNGWLIPFGLPAVPLDELVRQMRLDPELELEVAVLLVECGCAALASAEGIRWLKLEFNPKSQPIGIFYPQMVTDSM